MTFKRTFCLLAFLLTALSLNADFTVPGWKGKAMNAAQWAKLCAALECLKDVDNDAYNGIKCMKGDDPKTSHVCVECKKKDVGAGANTDGTPGKSDGDGINIPPATLCTTKEILAAILAHEWVHVKLNVNNRLPGATGTPERRLKEMEKPAYEKEIEVLKKFKKKATGTTKAHICQRIAQLERLLKKMCDDADKSEGKPTTGPAKTCDVPSTFKGNGDHTYTHYVVNSGEDGAVLEITHALEDNVVFYEEYLPLVYPQDVLILEETGLPVDEAALLISGLDASEDIGWIMGMTVNSETTTGILFELQLPGISPAKMVYDNFTGTVLILDDSTGTVWRLLDEDGDGIPNNLSADPFANADQFPFLNQMRSMVADEADEGGIRFSAEPDLGVHSTEDTQYILVDNDGDGMADAVYTSIFGEDMAFIPGFVGNCVGGESEVTVFGPWGHEVLVRNFEDGQVLGRGVINQKGYTTGLYYFTTIKLGTRLFEGQVIEVLLNDGSNMGMEPRTATVQENFETMSIKRLENREKR